MAAFGDPQDSSLGPLLFIEINQCCESGFEVLIQRGFEERLINVIFFVSIVNKIPRSFILKQITSQFSTKKLLCTRFDLIYTQSTCIIFYCTVSVCRMNAFQAVFNCLHFILIRRIAKNNYYTLIAKNFLSIRLLNILILLDL